MTKLIWPSEDIVRAVRGKISGAQNGQAHGVSIDSRTVQKGDLFIALKGPNHNGHDYVADAIKAGAAAAIVSRAPNPLSRTAGEGGAHSRAKASEWKGEGIVANNPSPASAAKAASAPSPAMRERENAPLILVEDTMKALEDLGRAGRTRAKAKIIAVTGSVGKTGTKEMLRLMLGADAYANEGSFNNQWGVPLSLARLPADAPFGVFELGMNHAGELGPLSKQVQPHIALITNVEAVHLEFFPSVEAIADAKAEIFLGMPTEGAAVLNRDNAHFQRLDDAACARSLQHIVGFGRDKMADARLIDCKTAAEGCTIEAEILGRPVKYSLGAPGEHLALNSLGALLACAMAGADIDTCAAALARYHPPKGRGGTQTLSLPGGAVTLIDESYNASPASVRAAIRILGRMVPKQGGRRVMALGDMRELGADSPAFHAALAKDLVEAKITRVHCCGEMMAHLYESLPAALRGFYEKDSATLASRVAADLHAGDIITIKGSNAIRMPLVIEAIKARAQNTLEKSKRTG